MPDYICFEDCAVPDIRKTRIVSVRNRRSGAQLGQIRWYGAWRQYCFTPNSSLHVTFNDDCLRRIADECKAMTTTHRASTKGAL